MGDLIPLSEDMSAEEKKSLTNYLNNGCPGLLKVKESDIFKWFGLYMGGKTYEEIASITKARKDLILYMSHKSKWHEKRLKHYEELTQNLLEKIGNSKLDSTNTIVTMIAALNKYYGDKFNKFLAQNDKGIIEGLDTKLLSQYYKSMEALEKLMSDPKDPKDPKVTVNMLNGVVKQTDEDNLEISDKDASDLLKMLAAYKKSSQDSE